MLGALEFRPVEVGSTLITLGKALELRIYRRWVMMLRQYPGQYADKYDNYYAGTYNCDNNDLLPSGRWPRCPTSLGF